jgi:hypothetical protein
LNARRVGNVALRVFLDDYLHALRLPCSSQRFKVQSALPRCVDESPKDQPAHLTRSSSGAVSSAGCAHPRAGPSGSLTP